MKILHFAFVVCLLLVGSSTVAVQKEPELDKTQASQLEPYPCEFNISTLSTAHQKAGESGLIIAIARLGSGELRRDLSRRRLHNVKVYLTEFDWHRAPETVITAEGERVKGYGRVELYVGGKLFSVLAVRPNRDLLVGSCEPEDERPKKAESNLYPYLDRKQRR